MKRTFFEHNSQPRQIKRILPGVFESNQQQDVPQDVPRVVPRVVPRKTKQEKELKLPKIKTDEPLKEQDMVSYINFYFWRKRVESFYACDVSGSPGPLNALV